MIVNIYAVIVTYNGIHWIDKCITSIENSSIKTNIIVVDNGSTDGSLEHITENFKNILLIKADKNLGFGQANNIGIKIAINEGAEFVLLLNQDAWVEENTIETLYSLQILNPIYGILSPMHLNGTGSALDFGFANYLANNCIDLVAELYVRNFSNKIYETQFVNAACWLLSKNCVESVGGFNPAFFHYGEDDNYTHRTRYHGYKIGIVPTIFIYHDRENRKPNFSSDIDFQMRKQLLVKINNPLIDFSLKEEIKNQKKILLKARLLSNKNRKVETRGNLKLLKSINEDSCSYRELSKKKGLTFLK